MDINYNLLIFANLWLFNMIQLQKADNTIKNLINQ